MFDNLDLSMKILTLGLPKLFGHKNVDAFAKEYSFINNTSIDDSGSKFLLRTSKKETFAEKRILKETTVETLKTGFLQYEVDVYSLIEQAFYERARSLKADSFEWGKSRMNQKYKNVLSSLISGARNEQVKEKDEELVFLNEHKDKVNGTAEERRALQARIQELEMMQAEKYEEMSDEESEKQKELDLIEKRENDKNAYRRFMIFPRFFHFFSIFFAFFRFFFKFINLSANLLKS